MESIKDEFAALPGWSPLILSMMYESQKEDSFWKPYFDVLPTTFTTPMFWESEDLKGLEGTDIVAKIGKEDAEATFERDIKPLIKKHTDIFNENVHTLDLYHMCGSLIMAYSFNDELQKTKKNEADEKEQKDGSDGEEDEEEEEEEEEEEDNGLISMVPMADMLNHKTGYNNARLFHETDSLQMRAIKDIAEGEQIYNTYGDLCNADLLRKYGFTDDKNEFDIVELDGRLIVETCCPEGDEELVDRKVDFLMEEGAFDECFVIDTEHEIPLELIVSVLVLTSTVEEFAKMEEKQKLPKPKFTQAVKDILIKILEKRLARYTTTLEEDQNELQGLEGFSNKRNALLVRIGEKQILASTLEQAKNKPVVAPVTEKRTGKPPMGSNKKQKRK